jgi:hypothetical protein
VAGVTVGLVDAVAQPGQEAVEALGKLEVGCVVDELGVQRVELRAQAGLFLTQFGHAGAELVEGEQLLLVGLEQPGDRGGGASELAFQTALLCGGGVGGTQLG